MFDRKWHKEFDQSLVEYRKKLQKRQLALFSGSDYQSKSSGEAK